MTTVSIWFIPLLVGLILFHAALKKIPTYETFVEGGKEGFHIAVSLIPYMVGMLVAISVFRASGAMEWTVSLIKPLFTFFGVPAEVAPLALIRPISGTGALGLLTDLIDTYGPDSLIGRLASTMQGSTDTTLYVLTVYFGAVGIRKMGHALKVGLLADLCGFIAAIWIVSIFF